MDRTMRTLREAQATLDEVRLALGDVQRHLVDRPTQRTAMRTASGQAIDVRTPEQTEIRWDDLRAGMRKLRYAGMLDWTIGSHLLLCFHLAAGNGRIAILAATHDLHEAYVMDIPKGLKECLGEVYREIEAAWEEWTLGSLGLLPITPKEREAVKEIDVRALALEMHFLGWEGWPAGQDVLRAGGPVTVQEEAAWEKTVAEAFPMTQIEDAWRRYDLASR